MLSFLFLIGILSDLLLGGVPLGPTETAIWTSLDGLDHLPATIYLPPPGVAIAPQIPHPTRVPVAAVTPMSPPTPNLPTPLPLVSTTPPTAPATLPVDSRPPLPPSPVSHPFYACRSPHNSPRVIRYILRLPLPTLFPPPPAIVSYRTLLSWTTFTPPPCPPPFIPSALFPYPIPFHLRPPPFVPVLIPLTALSIPLS